MRRETDRLTEDLQQQERDEGRKDVREKEQETLSYRSESESKIRSRARHSDEEGRNKK